MMEFYKWRLFTFFKVEEEERNNQLGNSVELFASKLAQ